MWILRRGFAQSKKKRVTNHMHRKLEQQKYEARLLRIPGGQYPEFLRQRKLVEQELKDLQVLPSRAIAELAEQMFFPQLLEPALLAGAQPVQLLPSGVHFNVDNELCNLLLKDAVKYLSALDLQGASCLVARLHRNVLEIERIRNQRMSLWNDYLRQASETGYSRPCPYQFWDREDILSSEEWQLCVGRMAQLAGGKETVDQAIQLAWEVKQFKGCHQPVLADAIVKCLLGCEGQLLQLQDAGLVLQILAFMLDYCPTLTLTLKLSDWVASQPPASVSGGKHLLPVIHQLPCDLTPKRLLFRHFLQSKLGQLTLEQLLMQLPVAHGYGLLNGKDTELYIAALLAKPGKAPFASLKSAIQLVFLKRSSLQPALFNQVSDKLMGLIATPHLTAGELVEAVDCLNLLRLDPSTEQAQFLAVALSTQAEHLSASQRLKVMQLVVRHYISRAMLSQACQDLPILVDQIQRQKENLQTGLLGGKQTATKEELISTKTAQTVKAAIELLWVVLRLWQLSSLKDSWKGLPVDRIAMLLVLIKPCRVERETFAKLAQVCVVLSCSKIGNHLPWTVVQLQQFVVEDDAPGVVKQLESKLRNAGFFSMADSEGCLALRAGRFCYFTLRETVRERLLASLGVQVLSFNAAEIERTVSNALRKK